MIVAVATDNPIKIRAVEQAFAELRGESATEVRSLDALLDMPEQPLGEQVAEGALRRALAASQAPDVDLGVGIEAGLLRLPGTDRWVSVQVCAIVDRSGAHTLGLGPGYELPEPIRDAVLGGEPLRGAFERILDCDDRDRRGAVFHLTNGRIDRGELTVQAVRMALIPRTVNWTRERTS